MRNIALALFILLLSVQNVEAQKASARSKPGALFLPEPILLLKSEFSDPSGDKFLDAGETGQIKLTISNTGAGPAMGVIAKIIPSTRMTGITYDPSFELGIINAHSQKTITFKITADESIASRIIKFQIDLGKGFNFDSKLLTIPTRSSRDFRADVDMNIPRSKMKNPDAIAVILGIERYRTIQKVNYAKRDAAVFREYAINLLGVPDDKNHIYFKTDDEVTKAEFEKLFTRNGWLARRVQPGSDVYIYYAGHGVPDFKEKSPYLIPSDGDANYPTQTGFSLNRLYEELAKLNVRSITVFLDACFSGGTRGQTTLLANSRLLRIKIDHPALRSEKLVVFSAASGDQISSGYPNKKHGLFTYFLLRGLRGDADKNNDKIITVLELEKYLILNVKKTAGYLDREQTPQVLGRDKQKVLVRY